MSTSRILLALAIALLGVACSSEAAPTATRRAHRSSTAGGERHADARHEEAQHEDAPHDAVIVEREEQHNEPPTAADQSETADDVEITRQIRVAIVGDSSLSFGARLCTIVTRDAVVTLRGDVSSNDERDAIDRHAHSVTGVARVDNLLSVSE